MSIQLGPYASGEIPEPLEFQFLDADGDPIDLTGYTATFVFNINGNTGTERVADVTTPAEGKVTYAWQDGDISIGTVREARLRAEFVVTNGTNRYYSDLFYAPVRASIPTA